MFSALDIELQKELLEFVKSEEADKTPKSLKLSLVAEILRQIVRDERKITGIASNPQTGDVFVRFSFTNEEDDKK